MSNVIR